ncbi:TolC family protein [Thalassotalea psychrophila]|uniref:TolC family protein n=1 Tax=Thalassotalea psychrophila TaxID=3065647 RepID=A0ABY9TY54_9GAMM|nr:TolC family protein [Colwelliaceae bacterium SQ149]
MHIRLSKLFNIIEKQWRISALLKVASKRFYLLITLFVSTSSLAQQPQLQQSLTLQQAIVKSLQQHPDLKVYSYQSEAAQGAIKQAGVGSPMSLNVKVEDVLSSGEYSEFSSMQTSISIAWLLEGDRINAKVNYAKQQATVTELNKQSKALDVAADTAKLYITLLAQNEQLKLAKIALKQSQDAFRQVEQRVIAGKSLLVDKLRAKASVAKKELVVEDLNHEIEASRASLAAQWQGDSNFTVTGSLGDIPSLTTVDNAYNKLKNHPKFKQLAAQKRISESAIAVAKANENPAWQFSAGVKHDELSGDASLTAGVSIPFGGENRNLGQIIELQAKQGGKQAELDAWYKNISTELLLTTHKLKHNRHVIEGLGEEIIPALEGANSSAEDAYRVGRYSYSEWYNVQQELIDAQFELIDAYSNVHYLNIELERLTGTATNL